MASTGELTTKNFILFHCPLDGMQFICQKRGLLHLCQSVNDSAQFQYYCFMNTALSAEALFIRPGEDPIMVAQPL